MGCKRDQSAVNVPCRSVTSGVLRVLFTMLNPSSAFPCEYAELRKRGLSTARSRDYLERRRSCLTRPAVLCSPACVRKVCHSCFSVREAALSPAAGTGHTGFLAPSGSQTPTFSRVDFTNFLDHIRKGCRPIFAQFSCRETESGVSRAWWVPLFTLSNALP